MQSSRAARPLAYLAAGLAAFGLCSNAFAQAAPRITTPVDESHLVTLSGNTHPIARAQYDLGPTAASGRMLLVFKRSPQQESNLQQLLRDQQNAASPQYHKWLTPEEFGGRFGIADSDLQTVTGFLQAKGFSVGKLSRGRMSLEVTGSSDQVRDAFHTEIHRYSIAGNQFFANDRDPQIPEALAPVVAGFASLNNYKASMPAISKQATFDPTSHTLKPLFTTTSGTTTYHGVSPGDLAKIYNIPAQTKPTSTVPSIGVISDSDVNLASIAAYDTLFALSASAPNVIVDGDDPGVTTDALTTTEELELISAVAPYATVNLYTSATTDYDTGFDFATVRAVGDDTVNIIDFGFLNCESSLGASGNEFVSYLWEQAAAQGITVISATGDAGAAACDIPGGSEGQETSFYGPAVNGWASTPYNTAVGGTDFYYTTGAPSTNYWNATNSGTPAFISAKGVIPQQPWNDSDQAADLDAISPAPLYAGGGGASSLGYEGVSGYTVPSWQTAELNGQAGTRALPDISLFAGDELNNSYYILCFASSDCASGTTSTFTTAGGTAAAASVFAGIVAQIVQKDSSQGNINPGLYTLAASSTSASFATTTTAFFDVSNGSNYVNCSSDCTGGVSLTINGTTATYIGYPAAANYDLSSGLGTINAGNLISKWSNINSGTTPGSVALSVYSTYPGTQLVSGASITHGVTTYLGAKVTAAGGKPTPTGDVAVLSTNIQASNKSLDLVSLTGGTGVDANGVQLPGGTYTMTAQYAGDTNYAPATSSPFTITVNPEPSQVLIMSANAQPVTYTNGVTNLNFSLLSSPTVSYGTPIRITVEPFGISTNPSIGIPSGSISVMDKGTVITSIPLNSEGSATFESNSLAVGSHSFTFSYAGDASFSASTSLASTGGGAVYNNFTDSTQTAVAVSVTTVSTTTALSATSSDLGASGGTSTLMAVVSSASPNTGSAPTGSVKFTFVNSGGGVSTNTVAVTPAYDSNGNLVAAANETISSPGTYTATFLPTGNYVTSTSNSLSISNNFCDIICFTTNTTTTLTTVGGGTTFSSSSDIVFNIQVKATYYLGGFIPLPVTTTNVTGSVIIYADGVQLGQAVTLDSATGSATFTVPKTGNYLDLPSGSVVFTAYYIGGTALPGSPLQFTADPSTGSDTLTIQGNSQGNPTSPSLSGDFSIQTLQTAQVMPAGTAGSLAFPVELTATNGFAQNYGSSKSIALTCTSSTPGLTCALSAASVGLSSGFGSTTATIKPSTNYTIAHNDVPAVPQSRWWMTAGGVAMGCVLLFGLPARRRGWQAMLGVLALFAVAIGLSGCSSNAISAGARETASTPTSALPGSGGSKTNGGGFHPDLLLTLPAGTYPITVTGTVTLNGVVITHNTVFNVVVQ
jgi:hypothetical protein